MKSIWIGYFSIFFNVIYAQQFVLENFANGTDTSADGWEISGNISLTRHSQFLLGDTFLIEPETGNHFIRLKGINGPPVGYLRKVFPINLRPKNFGVTSRIFPFNQSGEAMHFYVNLLHTGNINKDTLGSCSTYYPGLFSGFSGWGGTSGRFEINDWKEPDSIEVIIRLGVGVSSAFSEYLINEISIYDNSLSRNGMSYENSQLYPNPCKNELNIKSEANFHSFVVYDLKGMLVLKGGLENNKSQIDVSNLKSGAYLLILKSDSALFRQKFVKQ
jgi:hypothetical protein